MEETGRRIKFKLKRVGQWQCDELHWIQLTRTLQELEKAGCSPVVGNGRVGNIAISVDDGLIVSKSNRPPGKLGPENFVKIVNFDPISWSATYMSLQDEIEPTSDTPLYWLALIEMPHKLRLHTPPRAAIHGHELGAEEVAFKLNIPISKRETEFSTPKDREALEDLLSQYPYPTNKIYIRKGHGFFILASSLDEGVQLTLQFTEKGRNLKLT